MRTAPRARRAGPCHIVRMVMFRLIPCGREGQGGWAVERTGPSEAPRMVQYCATVPQAQAVLDRLLAAENRREP